MTPDTFSLSLKRFSEIERCADRIVENLGEELATMHKIYGKKHSPLSLVDAHVPKILEQDGETSKAKQLSRLAVNMIDRKDGLEITLALVFCTHTDLKRARKSNSVDPEQRRRNPTKLKIKFDRKLKKFKKNPHKFFVDAKNPLIRSIRFFFRSR